MTVVVLRVVGFAVVVVVFMVVTVSLSLMSSGTDAGIKTKNATTRAADTILFILVLINLFIGFCHFSMGIISTTNKKPKTELMLGSAEIDSSIKNDVKNHNKTLETIPRVFSIFLPNLFNICTYISANISIVHPYNNVKRFVLK